MTPTHQRPRENKRAARYVRILGGAILALLAQLAVAKAEPQPPSPAINTEQAKAIALKKLPGRVTDVTIEKKYGKNVYVVEIMTEKSGERDVFVDMQSGVVIGTD